MLILLSRVSTRWFTRGLLAALFTIAHSVSLAYQTRYQENVTFIGADNTTLEGNLISPIGAPDETFPAIVFINSWSLEEHQYLIQAFKLASEGYLVLSYSARGWGKSGGQVNVAGPKDMIDFSAALDWLIANTPVEADKIGAAGISYGGGMALLGAAFDDRVAAVASMSGWSNLEEALHGNQTVDLIWGSLLLGAGYLTGNMDPVIAEIYANLLTRKNLEFVSEWSTIRSPDAYIDIYNKRQLPIYISNNFRDELFEPNPAVRLFQALTGPKRMDLNLGNHTTAELSGLLGLNNYVWGNVRSWFNWHLKGIENNPNVIDSQVSMAVKFSGERDDFATWPTLDAQRYYLAPRYWLSNGRLLTQANTSNAINSFYNGIFSGASAGTPVIGSVLESHINVPIYANMLTLNKALSIAYQTPRFAKETKLRGIAELDLWLKPSQEKTQVIAYLYDVGLFGQARLISHGPVSIYNATPGQATLASIEFYATAYNVPKGHAIALVLDSHDPQYAPASLSPYRIDIPYSKQVQSQLRLPVLGD